MKETERFKGINYYAFEGARNVKERMANEAKSFASKLLFGNIDLSKVSVFNMLLQYGEKFIKSEITILLDEFKEYIDNLDEKS